MNLKDWMNKASEDERQRMAAAAGTSVGYLWQMSGGHRTPSPRLAAEMEKAMTELTPDRVVTRMALLYPETQQEAA